MVEACEQRVRDTFDGLGEMLIRATGWRPSSLIPFRTDAPFDKRTLCYVAPNGDRHRIEFLAKGQQAVFYGYHEGAKRDYMWRTNRDPLTVPPSEWVSITEIEADELLTELDGLLTEQFDYQRTVPDSSGNGHARASAHVTDVGVALAALDYAGQGGGGNIHDTSLSCINALIVQDVTAEFAVAEVHAAISTYAASNPLCARWDLESGTPPP